MSTQRGVVLKNWCCSPVRPVQNIVIHQLRENWVKKTGRLIIVHEDNLTGGWGAEVAALVAEKAFDHLDAPIRRICGPNTPVPFAPVMENYYLPGVEDIINEVRQLCR